MIVSKQVTNWMYMPAPDWYERFVTYEKDGQKYGYREHAHYYHGKTNIPKVERKRK
jgi:hypothetical protein